MSNVNLDSAVRPQTNWAGNIAFAAPDFYRPAAVSELQAVVARARQVRVLATGHSFNDMADSPGAQVSLAGLPPEVEVDSANSLVRVAAGLSYAGLASRLDAKGFALRNMASLPHISVAGACATATHGSGAANQNLAAAITARRSSPPTGTSPNSAAATTPFPAPWCTSAAWAWSPAWSWRSCRPSRSASGSTRTSRSRCWTITSRTSWPAVTA